MGSTIFLKISKSGVFLYKSCNPIYEQPPKLHTHRHRAFTSMNVCLVLQLLQSTRLEASDTAVCILQLDFCLHIDAVVIQFALGRY